MDGQTAQVVASHLAFAGVQPQVQVDTQWSCGLGRGQGTANGSSRAVEGGEEPVTGGVDLLPSKAPQEVRYRPVMGIEDGAPRLVAQRCGPLRRPPDVSEQQAGEDAIDLDRGRSPGENSMISSTTAGKKPTNR